MVVYFCACASSTVHMGFPRDLLLLVADIESVLCSLSFVRKKRQKFHFHKSES